MLIVYGEPLEPFEQVLRSHGMKPDDDMKFLTEAEHVHSSCEEYQEQFEELKMRLGMEGTF